MPAPAATDAIRARQIPGVPEALEVDEPRGLGALHWPGTALVVWRRPPPPGLAALLDGLPFEALPDRRLEAVDAQNAGEALARALGSEAVRLEPLLVDVAALARLYAHHWKRPTVRLRLEAIRDDACRRFHADQVHARLLCTYRGPGTEWLARRDVRRADDGHVGEPDPRAIRRLGRFEVGLLAGARAPVPCVHRSPPLAGSGRDRLLLVVDEGADPGC